MFDDSFRNTFFIMAVKEFDSFDSADLAFEEPYCTVVVFSSILHCSYICLDKRQ